MSFRTNRQGHTAAPTHFLGWLKGGQAYTERLWFHRRLRAPPLALGKPAQAPMDGCDTSVDLAPCCRPEGRTDLLPISGGCH